MLDPNPRSKFLKSRAARLLSIVLIIQAVLFYSLSRGEKVPATRPLKEFPLEVGNWMLSQEGVIEKEVQDVLKADDLLTRSYVQRGSRTEVSLFVAYFQSQRTGQAPHSPKNCLPGSGWVESVSEIINVPVPGRAAPIEVNRYLVQKGESKSIVVYWYQSRDRVVASEYRAKFFVVADALRYNRTDTAIVRVVAPVTGDNADAATQTVLRFVEAIFVPLRGFLPA